MEFPLMQWLTAASYKIFGNKLLISRVFNFLLSIISLAGIYCFAQRIFKNRAVGLVAAFGIGLSPTFFYYSVSPMPDNLALASGIWGLFFAFSWAQKQHTLAKLLAGILLSISVLCKLPFVFYLAFPAIIILQEYYFKRVHLRFLKETLTWSIFLLPPFAWYAWVIPHWGGNGILHGIFTSNPAEVLALLFFNLTATLPEMLLGFANVGLFLAGIYYFFKRKLHLQSAYLPFLSVAFFLLLYTIFEINMIAKIHDYYLFPFFPFLFLLVAYGAKKMWETPQQKIGSYFVLLSLVLLPITTTLRMQTRWQPDRLSFEADLLHYKDELRAAASKDALCVVGNDISHYIFFYYIDKKGWAFHENSLSPSQLSTMIDQGAQYLYSDSRTIDEHPDFTPYFDILVMETPKIRVYKLKQQVN